MPAWTRALLCVPVASIVLVAANTPCDPGAGAQKALDEMREKSRDMKYSERLAYQRKTLEDLLRHYPGEMVIERRYVDLFKYDLPDELPALRRRYQQRAERNPNDPAALYVAGLTLQGYKTAEAIRLMERAKQLDPAFGWPYLSLANTYSGGKFGDKKKTAENIAAYFHACPDSTSSWPLSLAGRFGSPELQAATAKRLRERLARESDPKKLELFSDVWGLEFRTRPVTQHPALRKQVAEDVKGLEPRNPKPDAEWLDFLKNGLKQSGASKEALTAAEDRILKEFPSSDEALSILRDRWRKDHPDLKPEDSAATWNQRLKETNAAIEGWIRQFPKADYLKNMLFYNLTSLDPVPLEQAARLAEENLKLQEERWGPESYVQISTAQFYLKNHLNPERALALVRSAWTLALKDWERQQGRDDLTDKQLEDTRKYRTYQEQNGQSLLLKAYKALHRVEEARALKPELEGPPPKDPAQASTHWANLALEAEIEGHNADALTYYQAALNARAKPPDKRFGRVEDPLLDDARSLFMAAGGTETAWSIWSKRPAVQSASATDGRWERPNKPMAAFELADLTGKTWSLKRLEGKTVLIAVWASW